MEWKYKINEKNSYGNFGLSGRVWVFLKWIIASIRLLWCLDFIGYFMLKSGVTILVLNDIYINKAWHSLQLSVLTKWN